MKASVLDGARYGYSVENDGQDETNEKLAFIRVNSCPFVVELAYAWIRGCGNVVSESEPPNSRNSKTQKTIPMGSF